MVDNIYFKILWVLVYVITAYYTFTGKMQIAMDWMAGGMLAEAIVSLIFHFFRRSKKSM